MSRIRKSVYIVGGCRSPFLKAVRSPGPFSAAELSVQTVKALMLRGGISAESIEECILGCVIPAPDEANIARIVALRSGCRESTPAWTVQRNCASGLQAIDCAWQSIGIGRSGIVLAGGVEVMSRAPLQWNHDLVQWFDQWRRAKNLGCRIALLSRLRPTHLKPVVSLLCGLSDPVVNLSMGQTAEILANDFCISRKEMDEFSMTSHKRLEQAQKSGNLDEISPVIDSRGQVYEKDTGLRADTTVEKLAKLRPVFDRNGLVTAGNSAQITDGAAMLLLADREAVKKHGWQPESRIIDISWAALDPRRMGLGPAYAITRLLKNNSLTFDDIDLWEINEAFAAQVLACVKAMSDTDYARKHFDEGVPVGEVPLNLLNVDGGAISIGHPIGASGARITLHLSRRLNRLGGRYGVASLCIGGGQGGAILIENMAAVKKGGSDD